MSFEVWPPHSYPPEGSTVWIYGIYLKFENFKFKDLLNVFVGISAAWKLGHFGDGVLCVVIATFAVVTHTHNGTPCNPTPTTSPARTMTEIQCLYANMIYKWAGEHRAVVKPTMLTDTAYCQYVPLAKAWHIHILKSIYLRIWRNQSFSVKSVFFLLLPVFIYLYIIHVWCVFRCINGRASSATFAWAKRVCLVR